MMRKSLVWKLTIAFVFTAVITAGFVTVFIRLTSVDRLTQLILDQQRNTFEEKLSLYYTTNGSWDNLQNDWQQIESQTYPTPVVSNAQHASNQINPPPDFHERRRLIGLADAQGTVIVSVDKLYPSGSKASSESLKSGTAIMVNNEQVGTLLIAPQLPNFNPEESNFLQRTNQALIYGVLGASLVALIVGILLARTLIHPLKELTIAAENIAQGQLEQEVKVTSEDEIGKLAQAFNRMSLEVAQANHQRRQMTADIAHDLRTPLTVIAGYVESMRDEVLQPTPARLNLIYSEIERLQQMVGDLRMLSLADAGELSLNPQEISPISILEKTANIFQFRAEQQNITLSVKNNGALPNVKVDEARLMQVMDNLISNSLRYTPAEGKITLSAMQMDKKVKITVQDSGAGIPEEELPLIFDRFHRADPSRHAETGESGLGLAIVKALVEAHGGTVWAESISGEGTSIHFTLPIAE